MLPWVGRGRKGPRRGCRGTVFLLKTGELGEQNARCVCVDSGTRGPLPPLDAVWKSVGTLHLSPGGELTLGPAQPSPVTPAGTCRPWASGGGGPSPRPTHSLPRSSLSLQGHSEPCLQGGRPGVLAWGAGQAGSLKERLRQPHGKGWWPPGVRRLSSAQAHCTEPCRPSATRQNWGLTGPGVPGLCPLPPTPCCPTGAHAFALHSPSSSSGPAPGTQSLSPQAEQKGFLSAS